MNENLDLTKILGGCPKGTKLYSSIFGEVNLESINTSNKYPIGIQAYNNFAAQSVCIYYTKEGRYCRAYDGECTLFPSKDQRDWSKFERFWDKSEVEESKVEKFDINTLQPFDKVLVRDYLNEDWMGDFFEKILEHDIDYNVACVTCKWTQCIPYNEETKHLLGTREDCPEYYKWWDVKQEKIAQNFLNKLKL